ncbi:MAG TPA: hypothetical protein VD926_11980, partial [Acidimicrobiales bacterium]|nr:hypothetical protein [Acidimicrobiales bacterium]
MTEVPVDAEHDLAVADRPSALGLLDDLDHTLDLLQKVDLAGAPSEVKCAVLERTSTVQNRFDAFKARAMTAFESTQEHRVEGHTSAAGWLKSHAGMEGRDAARWQRQSRFAKRLPLASEALARGEITMSHVEHLHRAQQLVGEEAFALAEEVLVDAAIEQRFSDFQRTL